MRLSEINLAAQRVMVFVIGFIIGFYIVAPWMEKHLGF